MINITYKNGHRDSCDDATGSRSKLQHFSSPVHPEYTYLMHVPSMQYIDCAYPHIVIRRLQYNPSWRSPTFIDFTHL